MICDGCGKRFEARSDARFCSGACRQRDYRNRGQEREALADFNEARYGTRDAVTAFETMVEADDFPWSVTDKDAASRNAERAT